MASFLMEIREGVENVTVYISSKLYSVYLPLFMCFIFMVWKQKNTVEDTCLGLFY